MFLRVLPALLLALVLSGCFVGRERGVASRNPEKDLPEASRLDPSQVNLVRAQNHFRNEDYGLAETYFRRAVEKNPNNGDAWIGLAASYDRLRRFDLAERAYRVVVQKVGYTASVHNNLGYHHYLRGNMRKAREHFDAAHELEPSNPYILNNLKLVDTS